MSKLRRRAHSATRVADEAAAKAESGAPKSGRRVGKAGVAGKLRKGAVRRTRIQRAADQASEPTRVDDQLRASDDDVLRIADAIAQQRAELMDRLAQ
ncbi:hypothetical protein [Kribbella sp. NPDC004536]|uniref:hypothetical protein n=1 Tax=Kribbella sp. NPDC004536 TaxID=3364106 RepID=UPI00367FC3D2